MVEFLQVYLPILIYILLIILLVVGIILVIRLLGAMEKVNNILNSLQKKVDSLNGLFSVIDFTTDRITAFKDSVVEVIGGFVSKIKHFRKPKYNIEDGDDFYE